MNASELYPSKYLKASDLGTNQPVVKILAVKVEILGQGEDQDEKPVIHFESKEKALVCNKTNWNTLIELFGNETDEWIGKRIKILSTEVAFKGKMGMAIRISPMNVNKETAGSAKPAQPAAGTEGTPNASNSPDHDDGAGDAF